MIDCKNGKIEHMADRKGNQDKGKKNRRVIQYKWSCRNHRRNAWKQKWNLLNKIKFIQSIQMAGFRKITSRVAS